jgi:biopolymer transport protein ExbB/TolQ
MTFTEQLAVLITRFGAEWVLWLLVVLSVISISVMAERIWFYGRRAVDVPSLALRVADLLDARKDAEARDLLVSEGRGSMATAVGSDMIDSLDRGTEVVEQHRALAMARERPAYERGLSFLGTLGNNAPFIGLFGTVLGIIKAFGELSGNIQGGAQAVMAGISEALVATAIGLLVALPAVVAFNTFRGKVKEAVSGANVLAHTLLSHAHGDEANGGPEGD